MEQLWPKSSLIAQVFEERRNRIDQLLLVERDAWVAALRTVALACGGEAASAVATELDPHMGKSVSEGLLQRLQALFFRLTALMVIDGNAVPRFSAEHFVDRHTGALAFDVPQSHIHGGEHVVVHRAVAPVVAHLCRLPQVFDSVRIFPDQPRFQMIFQSGNYGHGLVVIVGRTDAINARLAGDDLEENPTIMAAPVGGDNLAILDSERRQSIGSVSNFLRAGNREARKLGSR